MCEPWDSTRAIGQSGEDDKGTLQEVYGGEIQGIDYEQRT